jgi:hypothetical protein
MEDMLFQRLASSFFFTFSFRFLLGPARDWSRDRAPAQTRPAKEGREGREGKEGRKGRKEGKEGAGLRRGKERACGADDGWIDGHRREQDIERREGGLGRRQNEKREGNERVAWTAVLAVCFIDRTW